MREFINILEAAGKADIKKDVIDLVKSTTDEEVLQRVLKTLKAGNIEARVAKVLAQDVDASKFTEKIAQVIASIDAPIEEKNAFLEQFPEGVIEISKLTDGNPHTFSDCLGGAGFNVELFKILSTTLVSQGVGPGEVALAVMHPQIKWSGRAVGGGDVQIGKKAVEVKTTVASGGRWINARKATMDMAGIEQSIVDADLTINKTINKQKNPQPIGLPARLGVKQWVDQIRPSLQLEPKVLKACAKKMADGLFNHTDNSAYQTALIKGNAYEIAQAILQVGFDNYKAYSNFDGILLMDMKTESLQYFTEYSQMIGRIKYDTPYLYAPESEAMPKVTILPHDVGASDAGQAGDVAPVAGKKAPAAPVARPKSVTGGRVNIRPKTAGTQPKSVGRAKR